MANIVNAAANSVARVATSASDEGESLGFPVPFASSPTDELIVLVVASLFGWILQARTRSVGLPGRERKLCCACWTPGLACLALSMWARPR